MFHAPSMGSLHFPSAGEGPESTITVIPPPVRISGEAAMWRRMTAPVRIEGPSADRRPFASIAAIVPHPPAERDAASQCFAFAFTFSGTSLRKRLIWHSPPARERIASRPAQICPSRVGRI